MTAPELPPGVRVFKPRNKLKEKVGDGPAQLPDGVEAVFQASIQQVFGKYLESLRAEVERMHAIVHDTELDVANDDDSIRQVFSISHRIRGEAATLGHRDIGRIADALCDFAEALTKRSLTSKTVISLHVDAMAALIAAGGSMPQRAVDLVLEELIHASRVVLAREKVASGG